jgi:hypothetical protein
MSQVSQKLREQDQPMFAQLTEQLIGQVDRGAAYLRGKDLDDVVTDVERLARRQPAVFVGGAFMLGLLASRFLKSSAPRETSEPRRFDNRGGYATGFEAGPGYTGYGGTASHPGYQRDGGSVGASGASNRMSEHDAAPPQGTTPGHA